MYKFRFLKFTLFFTLFFGAFFSNASLGKLYKLVSVVFQSEPKPTGIKKLLKFLPFRKKTPTKLDVLKKISKNILKSLKNSKKEDFLLHGIPAITLVGAMIFLNSDFYNSKFKFWGRNSIFKFWRLKKEFLKNSEDGNKKIKNIFGEIKEENINEEYSLGYAPIHYACKYDNVEIFDWLARVKKADIDQSINTVGEGGSLTRFRDATPKSPIDIACQNNSINVFKYFAENTQITQNRLMRRACYYLNLDFIKYLYEEKKIAVNFGAIFSPHDFFSKREKFDKQTEIVKYLIKSARKEGLEIEEKFARLIHRSVQVGNLNLVKFCVENVGANVSRNEYNIYPEINSRPLRIALEEGHLEVVRYLLKMGAGYKANYKNYVKSINDPKNKIVKFLVKFESSRKIDGIKKKLERLKNNFEVNKSKIERQFAKLVEAFKQEEFSTYDKKVVIPYIFELAKNHKDLVAEDDLKTFLKNIRFDESFLTNDYYKDAVVFAEQNKVLDLIGNSVDIARCIFCDGVELDKVRKNIFSDPDFFREDYRNNLMKKYLGFESEKRNLLVRTYGFLFGKLGTIVDVLLGSSEPEFNVEQNFFSVMDCLKRNNKNKEFNRFADTCLRTNMLNNIQVRGVDFPDDLCRYTMSFVG